jgi:hypothetical protein
LTDFILTKILVINRLTCVRVKTFLLYATTGASVAEWFWILSCEEAIQLAYGKSGVLLRCPIVPEIMHGRAPEVFLHH